MTLQDLEADRKNQDHKCKLLTGKYSKSSSLQAAQLFYVQNYLILNQNPPNLGSNYQHLGSDKGFV